MEQKQIDYIDIMELGFGEEETEDKVYFNKYGFRYAVITKQLTKKIYLDWAKETRLCELVRIDSPKTCNVMARSPILSLGMLKNCISFFEKK